MLKIHESTRGGTPRSAEPSGGGAEPQDGAFEPVFLDREGDALFVVRANESLPLPAGALEKVMTRFGGPLADDVTLVEVGVLDLDGGRRLRHVRHRARYDVIARDFLVLDAPGEDARCALATTVAGALEHLALAERNQRR